jgi:hypothetical protein
MNKRDYPTLHLDTNESKGTACGKKGYGCKWKRANTQHYTWTHMKVKERLVVIKNMDVNEQERLPNTTLRHKWKKRSGL